jgi:hypothetical protein
MYGSKTNQARRTILHGSANVFTHAVHGHHLRRRRKVSSKQIKGKSAHALFEAIWSTREGVQVYEVTRIAYCRTHEYTACGPLVARVTSVEVKFGVKPFF